jgi:hypothetical protein
MDEIYILKSRNITQNYQLVNKMESKQNKAPYLKLHAWINPGLVTKINISPRVIARETLRLV